MGFRCSYRGVERARARVEKYNVIRIGKIFGNIGACFKSTKTAFQICESWEH